MISLILTLDPDQIISNKCMTTPVAKTEEPKVEASNFVEETEAAKISPRFGAQFTYDSVQVRLNPVT